MIIDPQDSHRYKYDVGRPSYFSDESFDRWQRFFDYAETTPITIVPNAAYNTMKTYADNKTQYGGGGYGFAFWFASKADRKSFITELGKIFGQSCALDWRNVMFYRAYNAAQHQLRFTEPYLQHANKFAESQAIVIDSHLAPPAGSGWETDKSLWQPVPGVYLASGEFAVLRALRDYLDEQFLEFE